MIQLKYWELTKHLALREIKARYKQSFLGFFWIILNPFFQFLILSFVFSWILRPTELGIPYPMFLISGLLPWLLFSASLTSATNALVENSSLIKKIYFPRQILIISTLIAKLIDFAFMCAIFVGLMIWYQIPFTWYILLIIPILVVQTLFTYALSLFLSAVNLIYRDIQYLFNLILSLWFYLTPVVYPVEIVPEEFRWIFQFNPMSVFTNAYREVIFNEGWFNVTSLAIGVILSLILLVIAHVVFRKLEWVVADAV